MGPRVVIAGQMPPPVGGQNINTKRVHDLLSREAGLRVAHLKMAFTKRWTEARRAGLGKVIELVRVFFRAIGLRLRGRIDVLVYPSGGPHTVPIVRDLLLLPVLWVLSRRVVVHFRAAGLAERLEQSGGLLRGLCRAVYGCCCEEAIVLSSLADAMRRWSESNPCA